MSGNKNLKEVLNSLVISCDDVKYGFATISRGLNVEPDKILGTFNEDEGQTIIAKEEYLIKNNIPHDGPFAKLTIEIHTSLDLVGLTAVLASRLSNEGISANVVAAYYHDHIFVQYESKENAIEALKKDIPN